MSNIISMKPERDFNYILDEAKKDGIESGIVMGYNKDNEFVVMGGGIIDGRQPVSKDWLWMAQSFVRNLLNGEYADD